MAWHGGVTFKSKKYSGNTLHKSDVPPEQFSGRRRPGDSPGRSLPPASGPTDEGIVPDDGSCSKSGNGLSSAHFQSCMWACWMLRGRAS